MVFGFFSEEEPAAPADDPKEELVPIQPPAPTAAAPEEEKAAEEAPPVPAGPAPVGVLRVAHLKKYAEKDSNEFCSFLKSQHMLTYQYFMLFTGVLVLLFTCAASMVRLGAPSQYAEVSSPLFKLMTADNDVVTADTTIAFSKIDSIDDVYDWLEYTLEPVMYNGSDTAREGEIGLYSTVVGGIKVKQTRIRGKTCSDLDKGFRVWATTDLCYSDESGSDNWPADLVTYNDVTPDTSMTFWLPSDTTAMEHSSKIAKYKAAGWLDQGTSAVKIDMVVFNPNYQIYSVLHAELGFLKGGMIKPSFTIESMPIDPYNYEYFDNIWTGGSMPPILFDVLMCLFLVPVAVAVLSRLAYTVYKPSTYPLLLKFSVLLDMLCVGLFIATYLDWTKFCGEVLDNAIKDTPDPGDYDDLEESTAGLLDTSKIYGRYKAEATFLILFLAIRILGLIHFQPYLAFFIAPIANCANELWNFLVVFASIFFGFAVGGWHLFGQKVSGYGTLWRSTMTNLDFVMGNYAWEDLKAAAPTGSYFYFILFLIVIYVIFFNILLAIILSGYQAAKAKLSKLSVGHGISNDMFYLFKIVTTCALCNVFPTPAKILGMIEPFPEDGTLTHQDLTTLFPTFRVPWRAKLFLVLVQRTVMVEEELMEDTSFKEANMTPAPKSEPVIVNNYYSEPSKAEPETGVAAPTGMELQEIKAHFADTHEEAKAQTAAEIAAAKAQINDSSEAIQKALAGASETGRAHTAQEIAILKEEILSNMGGSTNEFKAHTSMELAALQEEMKELKVLIGNMTNAVAQGFNVQVEHLKKCTEQSAQTQLDIADLRPTITTMLESVNGALAHQEQTAKKMNDDLKEIESKAIDSMKDQQVSLHRDMSDTMAKQQLTLRKEISKWSNSVVKQQHVVTENMKSQQVSLHNDMIKILNQNQQALHQDLTENLTQQQQEMAESMVQQQAFLHEEMAKQALQQHQDVAASIKNQEKMADKITERLDYIQWVKDDETPAPAGSTV